MFLDLYQSSFNFEIIRFKHDRKRIVLTITSAYEEYKNSNIISLISTNLDIFQRITTKRLTKKQLK